MLRPVLPQKSLPPYERGAPLPIKRAFRRTFFEGWGLEFYAFRHKTRLPPHREGVGVNPGVPPVMYVPLSRPIRAVALRARAIPGQTADSLT